MSGWLSSCLWFLNHYIFWLILTGLADWILPGYYHLHFLFLWGSELVFSKLLHLIIGYPCFLAVDWNVVSSEDRSFSFLPVFLGKSFMLLSWFAMSINFAIIPIIPYPWVSVFNFFFNLQHPFYMNLKAFFQQCFINRSNIKKWSLQSVGHAKLWSDSELKAWYFSVF